MSHKIKRVSENKYDIYQGPYGTMFCIDKDLDKKETEKIIEYLNNHDLVGFAPAWIEEKMSKSLDFVTVKANNFLIIVTMKRNIAG